MWWWRVVSLVSRGHDDGKHEADTSAHAMRCACSSAQSCSGYGLKPGKWRHLGALVADYRNKSETTHDLS